MNGTTVKSASNRILALDILRGITIAGMLLVNNPGGWDSVYAPLRHADWHGLTPTDLVFPFFMFIMGVSTYISLNKYGFVFSSDSLRKILRRVVLIWFVGLVLAWLGNSCKFSSLRILGVMPRLALCYGLASVLALTVKHGRFPWVIAGGLLAYWIVLAVGHGFVYDGSINILGIVDRAVLGMDHMYNDHEIDPEGVLSTIPSVCHVLIGFCVGRVVVAKLKSFSAAEVHHTAFLLMCWLLVVWLQVSWACSFG